MIREITTIVIILFLVLYGNSVTDKYTRYAADVMINSLEELHINNESSEEKINDINQKWDEIKNKMAYYIEHDELEKVENNLKAIESAIEMEEEDEGEIYINQCKFVLKHIKEKYEFNLQNIF